MTEEDELYRDIVKAWKELMARPRKPWEDPDYRPEKRQLVEMLDALKNARRPFDEHNPWADIV